MGASSPAVPLPRDADRAIDGFAGLLRWRAQAAPDRVAYRFCARSGSPPETLSYGALDARARAVAAALLERGLAGTRALLLYPPGLEFPVAFLGCLYAGVTAVPAYPPHAARPEKALPTIARIIADAEPRIVLSIGSLEEAVRPLLDAAAGDASVPWLATDAVPAADARVSLPHVDPATLAFLQYTSGSTSTPKGVMVSHANLLHNEFLINEAFGITTDDVVVSWLPFYHDMGLIGGLLQPVWAGASCVLLSPLAFVQQPVRWLQAITEFGGTVSGGPNFGYEHCVRRIGTEHREALDLRRWRVAFNGAEPVRHETLTRFAETFGPCGFDARAFLPCYGLAEATLIVSGSASRAPAALPVSRAALAEGEVQVSDAAASGVHVSVSCGPAVSSQQIAIADPETGAVCAAGRVGEIWVRGPSVAGGYWRRPEETARSFGVHLGDGSGPFLRTGDLGFVHGDELHVTGRLKDLLIIRGRNHYPPDIELTVERAHAAVRPGGVAVFGTTHDSGEEQLAIVAELAVHGRGRRDAPRYEELTRAIRQAVTEHHEVQPGAIVLVEPGGIPRTSSNKIRRSACRERWQAGQLDLLFEDLSGIQLPDVRGIRLQPDSNDARAARPARPPESPPAAPASAGPEAHSRTEIEQWLVTALAERLGVPRSTFDRDQPFSAYGLDSREATSLSGALEDWLQRPLSPTLVYEHPTIAQLAAHLAGEESSPGQVRVPATPEDDLVAVIGIGCRVPGAEGPEQFWKLLLDGVDAIKEVPPDRWDRDALFSPDPAAPGKMTTRWGGFLERVDEFDAQFFGISPREAARMDPQQRVILEVAWEALEDAGLTRERLTGSRTGVFIGISTSDYTRLQMASPRSIDAYAGTGSAFSIAANRLSYVFDWRGPSVAIDTACSSSLVAIHLACQSLQRGESALAVAGGINLILSPAVTINFSKAGVMAPDGRCKAFDASANGYVRSEGAGVVILKPLQRALADGDRVYAVVRGSAVTQDGRTNGLMAPSRHAQEAVLREAYSRAGVEPAAVQYVECHGTGTLLGDPIEAGALGTVVGDSRPPDRPCLIGSVKTNIGHLEAAAGVAGFIKASLALYHGRIPACLHYKVPNPHIAFDALGLRVVTHVAAWPEAGRRLAGVSSFGFGGTNAHTVLESSPIAANATGQTPDDAAAVLVLSANSAAALRALAGQYAQALEGELGHEPFVRVCAAAAQQRTHHRHRLAVAAHDARVASAALREWLAGESPAGVIAAPVSGGPRPVVFVFPGQGSQWVGMGRALLARYPAFRAALEAADSAVRAEAGWSVIDRLQASAGEPGLEGIDVIQPVLWAIEVALARLWESFGVRAHAVVGHSMGEVAAARVAGALSTADAARVICRRSALLRRVSGRGAMAVVGLSLRDADAALAGYEDRLSVAVSNSALSTVISGDPAALDELLGRLEAKEVFTSRVKVDVASHSPQMDPLAADLLAALAGLAPRDGTIELHSTVTAGVVRGAELTPAYWVDNLRKPVRFSQVIERLAQDDAHVFVEMSPHPLLVGSIAEAGGGVRHSPPLAVAASRRDDEVRTLLESLGALWVAGHAIDWQAVLGSPGAPLSLPRYPWQRQRYWFEAAPVDADAALQDSGGPVPLGRGLESARQPGPTYWEITISEQHLPYLADHRVQGRTIVPAAFFLAAVAAAALERFATSIEIAEATFQEPLILDGPHRLQVIVSSGDPASFECYSRPAAQGDAAWRLHAQGWVGPAGTGQSAPGDIDEIKARTPETTPSRHLYDSLWARGLEYGPSFQGVQELWALDGKAVGRIEAPASISGEVARTPLHPALLDAALHVVAGCSADGVAGGTTYVPASVRGFRVHAPLAGALWSRAAVAPGSGRDRSELIARVDVLDPDGRPLVEIDALSLRRLASEDARRLRDVDRCLFEIEWQLRARHTADAAPWTDDRAWLVLADQQGVARELRDLLQSAGQPAILAFAGEADVQDSDEHVIDPADPAAIAALLDRVFTQTGRRCHGIVHLWSVDVRAADPQTRDSLVRAQLLACGGAWATIRAVAAAGWEEKPRLWFVTAGAQTREPGAEPVFPSQAPLWGLGHTAAHEHPELRCTRIDLGESASPLEVGALARELWADDAEDRVLLRDDRRYVARLVPWHPPIPASAPAPVRSRVLVRRGERWVRLRAASAHAAAAQTQAAAPSFQSDATYLVTGGVGGLGLKVARWMADRGAGTLVLSSRRAPGTAAAEAIAALAETGARVEVRPLDVSDPGGVEELLAEIDETMPPLKGVIHAAGVLDDGLLTELDWGRFRTTLLPKLDGAWNLHTQTLSHGLDHFVLFSSIASVLGSPGQANYAAANAFLDGLAAYRRALGLPAISINWGPWEEVGLAATQPERARLDAERRGERIGPADERPLLGRLAVRGMESFSPEFALRLFERLLARPATQVAVMSVDWEQFLRFYPGFEEQPAFSLLHDLPALPRAAAEVPSAGGRLREELAALPEGERRAVLESRLAERLARTVGLPADGLDRDQPLSTIGLDSLMAVEVRNWVSRQTGVTLPVVKLLRGPSVAQLAAELSASMKLAP